MSLGLFVGSLPLYGLHLPICVGVAWPLRLDSLVVYAAANISNPFVAPLLLAAEYQVGSVILRGAVSGVAPASLGVLGVNGIVAQTAVGAVVVGAALALLGGLGTAWLVRGARSRIDRVHPAIARTSRRYRRLPMRERSYVALKLRFDPLYRQLFTAGHRFGNLLDAGCGRGQFALYLKDSGATAGVRGFDIDAQKIAVACAASRGAGEFWTQSLVEDKPWPVVNTVLLVDVLHYLPPSEQERVLTRAQAALLPGGRLLLREIDAGKRSSLGRLAERIGVKVGMNRGNRLHFLEQERVRHWLEKRGFSVETLAGSRSSRLSNFVLLGTLAQRDSSPLAARPASESLRAAN